MTNPRARISLEWTCLPGDPLKRFAQQGITVISGRDTPAPGHPSREYGIFQVRPGGVLQDLASPFWHWGQFYEHVVRSVLDGSWNQGQVRRGRQGGQLLVGHEQRRHRRAVQPGAAP